MGPDEIEQIAREVAREEIASFSGMVLSRLGTSAREAVEGDAEFVMNRTLAAIFGEALRDFGGTPDEPGPAA